MHLSVQHSPIWHMAWVISFQLYAKPGKTTTTWGRSTCIRANSYTPIPANSTCRSIRETANTLTLACQCATHNIHKRPKAGRRHAKNVQRKICSIQLYIQNIPKDNEIYNSSTCFHYMSRGNTYSKIES